ncbi:PRC-barrel domain-containing protein [Sulfitobacter albidus]|uniref:PRC-barrel domain-containing protein n=1 Tax=Sulfitobacter albidus TaxID=2829501 RepID=A0A975JG30_9RHOB|nr:PRC-barrel domain-containing protein [Sulfitobacter albidus]QUJ77864.1 PRC-barrel domain-containing protein [Sulfitobacter albidus]
MTRNLMITTAAVAALFAAPMATAQTVSDDVTNVEIETKRPGIGIAEYDPTIMGVQQDQYDALRNTVGDPLLTTDNEQLGTITEVTFDGMGNPELVVDLVPEAKIDAEELVITLLPETINIVDGKIFLDTTTDELYLKAQQGSKRDDETSTSVTISS